MAVSKPNDVFPQVYPESGDKENYIRGHHLYLRDRDLDLNTVISNLSAEAAQKNVHSLHLYCDRLVYSGHLQGGTATISLPSKPSRLRYIHIFCRDFLSSVTDLQTLCFEDPGSLRVLLFSEKIAPKVSILSKANGQGPSERGCELLKQDVLSPIDAGRELTFTATEIRAKGVVNVSAAELEGPSIEDMQVYGADIRKLDNLSKLLRNELSSASITLLQGYCNHAEAVTNQEEVISALQFIVRCTKGSVSYATLSSQAKTLLTRLELPRRFPGISKEALAGFYVPCLDLSVYVTELNRRIESARKVAQEVKTLKSESKMTEEMKSSLNTTLEQMSLNVRSFTDINETRRKTARAIEDVDAKRRDMQASNYESSMQQASQEFTTELVDYGVRKHKELISECYKAGGEIIGSVVKAVITCGAGAPATVKTVLDVQNKIKTGISAVDRLSKIIKDLGTTISKLAPKLIAAYQNQSGTQVHIAGMENTEFKKDNEKRTEVLKGLNDMASKISARTLPQSTTQPIDFLGLLADWQEFDLDVDKVFDEVQALLEKDRLDSLERYRLALKKMVIRGQTLLTAMRTAQDSTQRYYRQLAENMAREARESEMKTLSKKASQQDDYAHVQKLVRFNLQRELATMKRAIYLGFHECLLSYIYFTNSNHYPAQFTNDPKNQPQLAADLEIASFAAKQEELEELVKSAARLRQSIPSTIDVDTTTHAGSVFQPSWRSFLETDRKILFSVPSNLPDAKKYNCIRIKNLSATFHGLTRLPTPSTPSSYPPKPKQIQYRFELGPQVIDRNSDGQPVQFYLPTQVLEKEGESGHWTDPKYQFITPPLFCTGCIVFTEEDLVGWDLSGVERVVVAFECEGVSKAQF